MISLYALHGFLGMPDDLNMLAKIHPSIKLYSPALHCPKKDSFLEWARQFNHTAAMNPANRILLGYSLGGRLAMHALLQASHLWRAAIIISSNPGLESQELKAKRLASDAAWAARFTHEPWEALMAEWNAQGVLSSSSALQGVLSSSSALQRDEKNYSREDLSLQLQNWSLGRQENLRERLAMLQIPILWMAGIHDAAYVSLTKELQFGHSQSKIWIAPNAGHRIPWDTPETFIRQVIQFIDLLQGEES